MKLSLPICLFGLGLAGVTPAYAQQYFNCEYSPRCEAIRNTQCAPNRDLKDKITLIRWHNSAEDVERTWAALAGLEAEYCDRLGTRGNIVIELTRFKNTIYPKLYGASCPDPQTCVDAFVKVTRDRWARDDLDAKIKADLEKKSQEAIRRPEPASRKPATSDSILPESWQTTTKISAPPRTRTRTVETR
jgi:hypothetical protein